MRQRNHLLKILATCFLILVSEVSTGFYLMDKIRLGGNTTDPDKGVVLLSLFNGWISVCYYGNQHDWGELATITACKQLGYQGGWPFAAEYPLSNENFSLWNLFKIEYFIPWNLYNIKNFDCGSNVSNLQDCSYTDDTQCKANTLAGVNATAHLGFA